MKADATCGGVSFPFADTLRLPATYAFTSEERRRVYFFRCYYG